MVSPQDMVFGQVSISTFMYRSLIPVTIELMQDSAFDLESWIREQLIIRLGRGTNVHFTTGSGSGQPKGFITSASSGVTGSSTTSISTDDLFDLEHSVDPAYRKSASAGWQMNDATLKVLKKLKDSQNRPLWVAGFTMKAPDTINGYPFVINQDMADVQASNKSLAFGDWSKFVVRDVRNPLIIRANELFIGNGQIGFFIFSRHGSNTLDAGPDPIKYLTHPSP
jgi:HK97 family phage major capsid protein